MSSGSNCVGFFRICGGIALYFLAGTSFAHHGFTNHFYPDREQTISGTVAEFRFTNPHVVIYIDVDREGEIENWKVEMGGTSGLLSSGRMSSESLKPGDRIEIAGHPSRHADFELRANRVTLPDGREITSRNPYEPVPFLQRSE